MKPTEISQSHFEFLKETLGKQGHLNIRIISDSMEPVIKTGEELQVLPCVSDFNLLNRFDILVFWNGKYFVCHYLWNKNQLSFNKKEKLLTTRGLKNLYEDFPIQESHILGVLPNRRIPFWWKLKIYLRSLP